MKLNEDLLREICEYMGSSLDAPPCRIIRDHMEACHNCEVYVDKIKKTVEIYRVADQKEELPAEVSKRLYTCLKLDDLLKTCSEDGAALGRRGTVNQDNAGRKKKRIK